MKKLFVLLLVATLSLQSCEDDNDISTTNPEVVETTETEATEEPISETDPQLLIGKWKIVSIEDNGVLENLDECELTGNIEFTSDITTSIYMEKNSNDVCTGRKTISSYTVENKTLTTINLEDEKKAISEIISLSNTKLVIKDVYEDEGELFTDIYTYEKVNETVGEVDPKLLIGKWKIVSIEGNGVLENLDECELTSNIEFTSDLNTSIYMEKNPNGVCTGSKSIFSYTVENNTLSTISLEDEEKDIDEIISLSNTKLVIKDVYEDEGELLTDIYTYERIAE